MNPVKERKLTKEMENTALFLFEQLGVLNKEIEKQMRVSAKVSNSLKIGEMELGRDNADINGINVNEYWDCINALIGSSNSLNSSISETRKLSKKVIEVLDNTFSHNNKGYVKLKDAAMSVSRSCENAEKIVKQNIENAEKGRRLLNIIKNKAAGQEQN